MQDTDPRTSISRHILYASMSILMFTLTTILIMGTLSIKSYIMRSETVAKQYVSLNERTAKAFEKPATLISDVVFGFVFKSLGEAEIISTSKSDSIVASSLKSIKKNSPTLGILVDAVMTSDDIVLDYGSRGLKAKLSEADAALGSIRTQLRVYYGENGEYPYSRERTYVMGATWNDFLAGELTGKYFSDHSYTYYCYDGQRFTITCDAGKILESNRTLDNRGTLAGGF